MGYSLFPWTEQNFPQTGQRGTHTPHPVPLPMGYAMVVRLSRLCRRTFLLVVIVWSKSHQSAAQFRHCGHFWKMSFFLIPLQLFGRHHLDRNKILHRRNMMHSTSGCRCWGFCVCYCSFQINIVKWEDINVLRLDISSKTTVTFCKLFLFSTYHWYA